MAPGLSRVIVYEENESRGYTPATLLSRMATDDLAKQLSCSWTWTGGPTSTVDNVLLEMSAQGQSFFQAAGDSDAYTGANQLDNSSLDRFARGQHQFDCRGRNEPDHEWHRGVVGFRNRLELQYHRHPE